MHEIIYSGQVSFPLIKIQTEEIISLIKKGSIRFNSLKLYRDFYNRYGDKTIGDPNEGKFFIHHGRVIITEKNIDKEVQNCYFSTANENDFVFCLFGVNPKEYDSFIFSEEKN